MRMITERDVIAGVRDRWMEQYRGYDTRQRAGWSKKTFGEIRSALNSLQTNLCSVSDVDEAIGATGWADNKCDECGRHSKVLMRFGEEPDYEARWQDLCVDCLSRGVAELSASETDK